MIIKSKLNALPEERIIAILKEQGIHYLNGTIEFAGLAICKCHSKLDELYLKLFFNGKERCISIEKYWEHFENGYKGLLESPEKEAEIIEIWLRDEFSTEYLIASSNSYNIEQVKYI